MNACSFSDRADASTRPPVDEIGYLDSRALLALGDDELRELVRRFRETHFTPDGSPSMPNTARCR